MRRKLYASILALLSLSLSNVAIASEPEEVDFVCDTSDVVPITKLVKSGTTIPVFLWKEEFFSANQADYLCNSVARKLKTHYQNGHMADGLAITTDWQKGKNLVCLQTTSEACPGNSHLFELASANVLGAILPEEAEITDDGKIVDELQGAFRRTRVRFFWW
ncbi:MAG: COP23 domain-containing protein [Spirulinaceae cyanobacterium]